MSEFVKISIFSIVLALASYVVATLTQLTFLHQQIYFIIGFLWLVYSTIHLTYIFLRNSLAVDSPLIPLVGLSMRLFITLFTIMYMVSSGIDQAKLFVINFIVVYFLYLGFEIIALLSNLRRNSSSDQN